MRKTEPNAHNKRKLLMSRKDDMDNHSNQLNPNNDAYWDSRGHDGRPDEWDEVYESSGSSLTD